MICVWIFNLEKLGEKTVKRPPSRSLTWFKRISPPCKRRFLVETIILRFRGCIFFSFFHEGDFWSCFSFVDCDLLFIRKLFHQIVCGISLATLVASIKGKSENLLGNSSPTSIPLVYLVWKTMKKNCTRLLSLLVPMEGSYLGFSQSVQMMTSDDGTTWSLVNDLNSSQVSVNWHNTWKISVFWIWKMVFLQIGGKSLLQGSPAYPHIHHDVLKGFCGESRRETIILFGSNHLIL